MFSPLQRTKSAENVRVTRDLPGVCQEKRPKTVSDLLIQIEGEGIPTKRKPKIEVKNYARENVLRLREIQRVCRQTKETRNAPVRPEYKPIQLRENHSSLSAYNNKTSCSPSLSYGQLSTTGIKMARTNQNVVERKHQGISSTSKTTCGNGVVTVVKQALPSVDRQKYREPDSVTRGEKNRQNSRNGKDETSESLSIPQLPLHKHEQSKLETSELLDKHEEDCLKVSNADEMVAARPCLRRSSSLSCILPPKMEKCKNNLKLPKSYQLGVVPKYLHVRQKQWRDDEERRRKEAPDPSVPPGLELLPDVDRLHTLTQLDQSYNELLKQMLMLPVRMDTLRIRQKRENIEKEMVRIEEAIKIFSQPKVYIKKDE